MQLKSTTLGGLIGIVYFVTTTLAAYLIGGGESEATMVVAQMLNLHVTGFFAMVNGFLPLSIASNLAFQFVVGLILSSILGALIGALVKALKRS